MKIWFFYCVRVLLVIVLLIFSKQSASSQSSIVQLFGEVITKETSQPLELVTIKVLNQDRVTYSNPSGTFSIVVEEGDTLIFSHVGYKKSSYIVPKVDDETPFYYVQAKLEVINYELPEFTLKSLPTKAQFERDFVNASLEEDLVSVASTNINSRAISSLMLTVPVDGSEAFNYNVRQQEEDFIYFRQQKGTQLLNPLAWAQFIKALKSGEFKLRNKK